MSEGTIKVTWERFDGTHSKNPHPPKCHSCESPATQEVVCRRGERESRVPCCELIPCRNMAGREARQALEGQPQAV